MRLGNYGLSVRVDGKLLPEIRKNGTTYLAAPWDKDFELVVKVPNGRTECVLSVDGLSAMSGKDATTSERGYTISGPGEAPIPGFRLNDSEVAHFRFGARGDSYAAQLGKPKNIGVIAAVFYAEAYVQTMYASSMVFPGYFSYGSPIHTAGAGVTFSNGGGASSPQHDVGTEFGKKTDHRVTYTDFERGVEVARFIIEYASYDALVASGVIVPKQALEPFPGDRQKAGAGCKPPKGWRE